jgi:peptidoglycan/LPS O-acetylase OafA/YrhL
VSTDRILARLSRRTSTGRYLPEVDGIRFVAITWVVLFHAKIVSSVVADARVVAPPFGNAHGTDLANGLVGLLVQPGQFGVHLFFVLSGFVLALPFASHYLSEGRRPSLGRYFKRRLTRLEPPYILALSLFFLLGLIGFLAPQTSGLASHFGSGLGYVHGLIFGRMNPIDGPTWSLEIEVQFYALMPLLALLFKIRDPATRRLSLLPIAMVAVGWQALVPIGMGPLSATLLHYLQFFLAGLLLADLFVTEWSERPRTHPRWDLAALASIGLLFTASIAPKNLMVQSIVLPAAAMGMILGGLRGPLTRRILTNRWIVTVGGMCYSIYLLHYPVLLILGRWMKSWVGIGGGVGILVQLLVCVPVLLALSVAFFVLVERPCMEPDWPSRLGAALRRLPSRVRQRAEVGVLVALEPVTTTAPLNGRPIVEERS